MASDGFRRWLVRHPVANAGLIIAMGGSVLALLLGRLREVLSILDFYSYAGAGRAGVARGISWTAGIGVMFVVAEVVRRRWWTSSPVRRWVVGVLVAIPCLGLLLTVPHRSGDPPGAGFCSSWQCVASSYVVWIGLAAAMLTFGLVFGWRALTGRQTSSRLHQALKAFERPTGAACRPVVTAALRDEEEPSAGWAYFFLCDCGVVGVARKTPDEADQDAREHSPASPPRRDIPTDATSPPPTRFSD
jgi:hypothetical protein